jgi:hypothetical protein
MYNAFGSFREEDFLRYGDKSRKEDSFEIKVIRDLR